MSLPFHCEMSERKKAKARRALCNSLEIKLDKIDADAAVEQVWNALVGHDKIQPTENEK